MPLGLNIITIHETQAPHPLATSISFSVPAYLTDITEYVAQILIRT